ncbi:hypothetical protein P7C70_g5996, partial [Phenoliferia sp. Uapishka_3]
MRLLLHLPIALTLILTSAAAASEPDPSSVVASMWSAIWVFLSLYVDQASHLHRSASSKTRILTLLINVVVHSILVAAAVSLCSAISYNRIVLHKRGTDQLPSVDKIRDGVSFAKDIFVISGIVRLPSLILFSPPYSSAPSVLYIQWFLDTLQAAFTKLHSIRGSSRSGGTDYSRGAWSRSAADGFNDDLPPGPSGILGDDSEDEEEAL